MDGGAGRAVVVVEVVVVNDRLWEEFCSTFLIERVVYCDDYY